MLAQFPARYAEFFQPDAQTDLFCFSEIVIVENPAAVIATTVHPCLGRLQLN